ESRVAVPSSISDGAVDSQPPSANPFRAGQLEAGLTLTAGAQEVGSIPGAAARLADPIAATVAEQVGPMSVAVEQEVRAIRDSGLFDESYYRCMYADVGAAQIDVIRHYCEVG